MQDAIQHVVTGEITTSTRAVTINGVSARNGQIIGLINDKLAVAGDDVEGTLLALLEKADAAGRELITLYHGNGLGEKEAGDIAQRVREAYPLQQVDLIPGDQPHYFFVVGIE
jgi:dihydroxyacetone kinase-like predicted kinase